VLPSVAHKLFKFSNGEVVRSIAPITLLLGPALLAIAAGFLKPWRVILSSAVTLASVLAVLSSPHETSKLALVGWITVFGLSYLSQTATYRILLVAWVSACLLVVPVSILAHSQDLQNAPWLQRSAKDRILIWHRFAILTLDAPLLGHGFDMTATTKPTVDGVADLPIIQDGIHAPAPFEPFRAIHPHNAYLQVWYELGALGVGLFMTSGLSILLGLSKLQTNQKPFLFATAAATMIMLFSSYGLLQVWFIGLLGFVTIACAIAIRLSTDTANVSNSVSDTKPGVLPD
jgi:O-antigen ligase